MVWCGMVWCGMVRITNLHATSNYTTVECCGRRSTELPRSRGGGTVGPSPRREGPEACPGCGCVGVRGRRMVSAGEEGEERVDRVYGKREELKSVIQERERSKEEY